MFFCNCMHVRAWPLPCRGQPWSHFVLASLVHTGDARDLTDTFGSENMGARTPLAPTMIANIGELEGPNNDQERTSCSKLTH
mmetsp:Transcript_145373/g.465776  ORF Transcript_145373/g.465776 Transcript_145373/m.465776 type:complete len:82 (+) Transcript_145373:75-320(+)